MPNLGARGNNIFRAIWQRHVNAGGQAGVRLRETADIVSLRSTGEGHSVRDESPSVLDAMHPIPAIPRPDQGQPLLGSMRYRMRFDKGQLPPVQAFWSLTAYDKDSYFIANPLNRYAIGDRDPLKFNPDGSLDLTIQSQEPGRDHQSNRLPSGDGPFNLTIRLYWPNEAILNGSWQPPALERLL